MASISQEAFQELTSILPLEPNSNIKAEAFSSMKQPKNPFKFSCLISRIFVECKSNKNYHLL